MNNMVDNISLHNFRYSSKEIKKYLTDFEEEIKAEIKGSGTKHIIFISGPMTGISDYHDRFDKAEAIIKDYYKKSSDYISSSLSIIHASDIFDRIDKKIYPELTYIDKMLFGFRLLHMADHLVLDDRTRDWESSTGCMAELMYAYHNAIAVDRLTNFIL